MTGLTVLLAGEEAAGLQLLQALAASSHRIAGVLTTPGSGVWTAAERLGLSPRPGALVRDPAFAAEIRAAGIDVLLNAHSLHIVHREVLAAPRLGAYNLHPGPLPRYAGLNAPSWAIFRGEEDHTVTVHRMAPRIDAGPIAYTASFPLGPEDTALKTYVACTRLGVPLMLKVADTLAADPAALPAIAMAEQGREVFGRAAPADGVVDWRWPAAKVAALARACDFGPFAAPWEAPLAALDDRVVRLAKVRTTGSGTDSAPGTVVAWHAGAAEIACGDGSVTVAQLIVDGRRHAAADVLPLGRRLTGRPLVHQPA